MREAYRDPLTGLPNRALFLERLERSLNNRHGGQVVVLFIDLDRFKAVNDSLDPLTRAQQRQLPEIGRRILRAIDPHDACPGGGAPRSNGRETHADQPHRPVGRPPGPTRQRVQDVVRVDS